MKMWILVLCLSYGWMQTAFTAAVTPTPSSAPVTPTEDESTQLVVFELLLSGKDANVEIHQLH